MEKTSISPKMEESWLEVLKEEFKEDYFVALKQFLLKEKAEGQVVYPPGPLIFNAFNSLPFDKVRVVILGQDPYHGPGQAHGLSFSVQDGVRVPPSLKNIYKEINDDLGLEIPKTGNLEPWAKQGVFLLNATLTVRHKTANSHKDSGWGKFTDAVIKKLSDNREGLVFMLWGRFAQNKGSFIDKTKHHVLESAHPSPFSARNGFFGNKHFSTANRLLKEQGFDPIDWSIG